MHKEIRWMAGAVIIAMLLTPVSACGWGEDIPVWTAGRINCFDVAYDLAGALYVVFQAQGEGSIRIVRSTDRGKTWRFYSKVAYAEQDPNPGLPGNFEGDGYSEPSLLLLSNGEMICMMRVGGWWPLRTMSICWSNDLGKTWTRPRPTEPFLYSIWPTLQLLDNGVVACVHGRPGFQVSFSMDNGKTWPKSVSLVNIVNFEAELVTQRPFITGQVDMIKSGPHTVLAIGGAGPAGTIVVSVTVELEDAD